MSSSTSSSSSSEADYASVTSDQILFRTESGDCARSLLPPPPPPPYCRIPSLPNASSKCPKKSKMNDESHRPCRRTRTLVLASVGFNLLCGIIFVTVALIYVLNRNHQLDADPAPQHAEVCMPCDEVRPNPLSELHSPLQDLLDVKRGFQDDRGPNGGNALDIDLDTEICCARTPAQYAALFKLILNRQEQVKRLAEVLTPQQQPAVPRPPRHMIAAPAPAPDSDGNGVVQAPHDAMAGLAERAVAAAHLVLKAQTDVVGGDEHHVQHWKSAEESPLSYVRGTGLVFQDHNKIIVRTPGLYFIYCQILFSKNPASASPADAGSSLPVTSSYVMRHSLSFPSSSGILLKARHSSHREDFDRHSSYVGGLFFLHKGDQMYVKVSHPAAVSYDSIGSFFGLFKVGA